MSREKLKKLRRLSAAARRIRMFNATPAAWLLSRKTFVNKDQDMTERLYAFEKLHVWADIRILVKDIYSITSSFPDTEKYCLANQMRRAAISVSSNLAEGTSRTGLRDQAHYYQLAYSSLMEVLSQLIVSHDLAFVSKEQYLDIRQQVEIISNKINALRKSVLKNTA